MDFSDEGRRLQSGLPDVELAWAAGFFDGEGNTHTAIQKPYRTASLHLTIGQVNRENLERFQRAVHGLGHISKPYDRGNKPISVFRAYGPEAQACIQELWPYLGKEKQDQALHALIKYTCRSVRGVEDRCMRGHLHSEYGVYTAPDGYKECLECRRKRRKGSLPKVLNLTAGGFEVGVRQYKPDYQT